MNAAQVHELAVLEHAQDLGLRLQAHGADFVEEDGAAVGDFEQALLRRDGAGERALHVPEQRGFQQVRRHRAGVHRDERLVAARRIRVDRLGDQFLAGAAFALISMVERLGATCATRSRIFSMGSLLPTMFSKL